MHHLFEKYLEFVNVEILPELQGANRRHVKFYSVQYKLYCILFKRTDKQLPSV